MSIRSYMFGPRANSRGALYGGIGMAVWMAQCQARNESRHPLHVFPDKGVRLAWNLDSVLWQLLGMSAS